MKTNRYNKVRDSHPNNMPAQRKRADDSGMPIALIIFRTLVLACVAAGVLNCGGVL